MEVRDAEKRPWLYLLAVTVIAVALIGLNVLLGMRIPFKVDFLIGYVIALLVFVVWHAVITKGWRRSLLMFSLSFLVAFTAEALGVNFGLIFGRYYYTGVLGFQVFGVPLLAALAWEPIVYAAYLMSDLLSPIVSTLPHITRQRPTAVWMALIGALATTAWDMMIDPIAVSQGWWVWVDGGAYVPYVANGVPVQNFLGWLGVAFVINLIYRVIGDGKQQHNHSASLALYGPLTLYASLYLTSVGVTLTILGRPEIALVGTLAMGPFLAIGATNISILRFVYEQLAGVRLRIEHSEAAD
jgi:putative membrane protein